MDSDDMVTPTYTPIAPNPPAAALTNSTDSTFSAPPPRNRAVSFNATPQLIPPRENSEQDEDGSEFSIDDVRSVEPHRACALNRNDSDHESEEEKEDSHEVVLSIFWKGSKLGAAVYMAETSEVLVLSDIPELAPQFNVTKTLLLQIQPSQIATCGRLAEAFINVLKNYCGPDEEAAGVQKRCYLNLMTGNEYKHEFIKNRILALRLPSEPEACRGDDKLHLTYIHSLVDLNNDCSVYALGALLKFLDKHWGTLNLEVRDQTAPIVAVKKFSLTNSVCIDLDTFTSLQIFSNQISPNNISRGKSTAVTEGLSLFALFNRCKSTMGCKALRMMMLKPTYDIKILNDRLDVIDFCIKANNKGFVEKISEHMSNVKGVLRILTKLKAGQPTVKDWKSLVKTIYNVVAIGELCDSKRDEVAIFQKIADSLSDDLYRVGQSINTIMDMEESENQKRFVVHAGVDMHLDRKKQEYCSIQELLTNVAQHELNDLPTYINECTVNYIPEIGFLLAVPFWSNSLEQVDFELPGMKFVFISENVAHYKTPRCKELDRVVGDVLTLIMEKESEIMLKLIQFVESKIYSILDIMELLAEFDCLSAMAVAALENNYVRPVLTEERVMEIKNGRHPLQELCVSDFVPNDTDATKSEMRMKILTGANASGKSVYLKQVALISYMAHIGSFVPATSAKIGLLHEVFTRIQTVESISSTLSAFMIDLRQMALALQCSSPRSLIVIDEFGKGTSELDGLALLAASLNHWLRKKGDCPLVLISTHFHSVADLLIDQDSPVVQRLTLDHLCNDKEVIYLYKLKEGNVSSSFAHQVAEAAGIDPSIIRRAKDVMEAMKRNEIPKKVDTFPVTPISGKSAEEIEKQHRSFCQYMMMTEDEIAQMSADEYFELMKNI
ncbi:mutS protein homolog 5-like [Neocloeon triangulifer]|uniref:mutS protein homolog 5-like n=1 Tax=Neocloeon triangulifer TaxID=2078957 RepID=UPI00286F6D9E|nr:mutS protein homolog 5-like [Neocloeon triangulifer]